MKERLVELLIDKYYDNGPGIAIWGKKGQIILEEIYVKEPGHYPNVYYFIQKY